MIHIYIESGIKQAKKHNKETTNEQDFLEKFIAHHYPTKIKEIDYAVEGFGGKDKLAKNKSYLEMNPLGDTSIVIFDADTEQNFGGYNKRKQEIEKIKNDNAMDFELFLWPNNSDDGDFESLLIEMINQNHDGVLDCFDKYEMCVGGHDPEGELYNLPGRKAKIYTYIEMMKKSKEEQESFKRGYWLFNRPDLWNMDAPAGNALKNFLDHWLK